MNKSLSFKYFKYEYSKNLKMLLYMGVVGFVCYIIPLFSMEPNIHTKTITGRLIYKFADLFIVQWESMLELYPEATYGGWIF